MFKYWLKNRAWLSLLFIAIIAVLMSAIFMTPQIKTEASNRTKIGIYEDSQISYDIPSPTKDQLEQIAQEDFVDQVFGYYYTETQLTFKGKNIATTILFSDYMSNVGFTMYSDKRCIERSDAILANPIYIDYAYAKEYGVSLGDQLSYGNITFDVQAIYETNTYYGSAILIPLVGAQKELIESHTKSYSGAYIKTNDDAKAQAYWYTYKPQGRLKQPEDFSTQEAYDYHYAEWNATSYLNEITNFASKEQSVKLDTYPNRIIWSVLFVVLGLAFDVILFFRKGEKRFFKTKEYSKDAKLYYALTCILEVVVGCIVLFVAPSIIVATTGYYVSATLFGSVYAQIGITLGIFAILSATWSIIASRVKK